MKKQTALCIILFIFLHNSYGQRALISGNIQNLAATGIKCSFISNSVLEKPTAITIPVADGKFTQALTIAKPTFLSFEEGKNYYGGFIEPGDSIVISYDATKMKSTLSFSGKGKEKFIMAESIMQLRTIYNDEKENLAGQKYKLDYLYEKIDNLQNALLRQLMAYKPMMATESFNHLSAFIKANALRAKYNGGLNIFGDTYSNAIKNKQAMLSPASNKAIKELVNFDGNLSYSYFYVTTVAGIFSAYYDDNIKPGAGDGLKVKYSYLSKKLPAKLKAPVSFSFLEREIRQNKDSAFESITSISFPLLKDSAYKNSITQKLMAARSLKPGIAAPAFALENINGEKISLASFKGKVVYMDYWFAACGPCHKLFEDTKPAKEYFKNDSNVVFLYISIDGKEVWKNAIAKFKISGYNAFTENKFRDHPIIRAYNVMEYPTTYLIGKGGEILSTAPSHNPDELKKEIENALQQ